MRGAAGGKFLLQRKFAPPLLAVLLGLQPPSLWAKDPAALYMLECQGCHLSDGRGGLHNIPTLRGHVAKFLDVAGGREYLVQVPGVALSSLSDQDLADVLNWMLHKFGPAESASNNRPFTVDEVAALRKHPMMEINNKRADLVLLIDQGPVEDPTR